MKKIIQLLLTFSCITAYSQIPEVAFTIPEKDFIPEGITYDEQTKTFFIGSIYKRKIVKVSEKGKVSDFAASGQDGLLEVLGMKAHNGLLWACNNTPEKTDTARIIANIHVFEIKTGKLVTKYTLADSSKHLFNDIHFTKNGDAYITDSDGGGVFVIKNGSDQLEPFVKGGTFRYPNGITATPDEKKILVSTGSGLGIVAIDIESKGFEPLPHDKFLIIGTDGLYRYNDELIGIQNVLFPESVVRFVPNKTFTATEKIEFVTQGDRRFDTPTTGVIVNDDFYFIANSQLFQLIGNNGKLKNPAELKETLIMKIKLN